MHVLNIKHTRVNRHAHILIAYCMHLLTRMYILMYMHVGVKLDSSSFRARHRLLRLGLRLF